MAYSGPASSYGTIGKSEAAYFAMINDQGGINGRKINFISRDDGYSPPKTVEQVRQLVEQDQVLFLFQTLGTPPNIAIQGYLNDNKVPQLFVAYGASKWNDPRHFPWTMGWQPNYPIEGHIYARYILKTVPDAKLAVLTQNDDSGKDYFMGLREGLGDKADKVIVATQTYETTDATVDSQIVALHVLRPAGLLKGVGIISAGYLKDPTDPQWQDTPEYKEWLAWMKKYNTSGNVADSFTVYGYSAAQTLVAVLRQCGDTLTRENLMKQAASIHDLKLPMLLPGITVSTGMGDFAPIKQMQLEKFDGTTWRLFGDVISGSGS
jgi:branched-chain amino acid transport system substrate-binding protein